jgi:tetratricopeptide (TPR) repeat protein
MRRGELVADRFEIEELIGSGGMGSIHRARDRLTGEQIALKTMRGAKFGPRFVREARVLAELSHPAVVRYVAHGPLPSGEPFLAMEWLDGEDLAHRLPRAPLSPAETIAMCVRVASALGAAHAARIIHRDVKPGNIFLPGGDVTKTKLIDFGIAHMIDATRIATQKGAIVGTPGYMAPEQAKGMPGIDARADVFSIGCVLYRCLSGRAPFEGDDLIAVLAKLVLDTPDRIRELGVDIPVGLDDLVAQMLSKRPDERPKDGTAAAEALAAIDLQAETKAGLFGLHAVMDESITAAERRLISVVVMAPDAHDTTSLAEDGPTTVLTDERLVGAVQTFGAQVFSLANGSLVATLRGEGEPTDQAAQAARYALSLRVAFPTRAMVLATGHHVLGDRMPISEVVDRAAAILGRTAVPAAEVPAGAEAAKAPIVDVRVRLDEVTAGLVSHRFEISGDPISLFLLRERQPFEDVPRTLLGAPISLVGRERELSMLESIYAECTAEPEACAVVVTAPAGVGKSRLGTEFLRRIQQRGESVEIWIARGDSLGAGAPFRMLGQAIRWSARILDGEPLPVRQKKLRARLGRNLAHLSESDLPRVAEFLGELCGTPFPDEGRVELLSARRDPVQMGDEMRRAWEDFLLAECSKGPVVIVLEDLHWGDLPSVQWIDAALRNLHDRPLLILALCRPEVTELFPALWGERRKHEIRLVELSRRASERMAREALGDAAHPEVIARIIARAAGNAFYLEELIRAVAEGRGDQLPETVLAMVEARLAALPADARRVLRAASVFGQTFWRGGVTALLGEGPANAESRPTLVRQKAFGASEWLDDLSRREIIARRPEGRFPEEPEYVFRHTLVRDAAYAMLTEVDQRLGHRLSAAWLEKAGEADAAVLAEHLERAGEPRRAVGFYLRAAEQALEGNDFATVLRQAKRGVACGAEGEEKGALLLVQAEAHKGIGHNADVAACAAEAMQLLPKRSPKWFSAVADLAFASSKIGNDERLIELSRELVWIDGRGVPDTHAIAAARVAAHLFIAGQGEAGDRLLAMAESARGASNPDAMMVAFIARAHGIRRMLAGDIPGFLASMSEAAASFERAGALRSLLIAQGNVGYAYLELGAFAEAEQVLRDALAKAERMGLSEPSAGLRQNLALALARKGELGEAKTVVTTALKAAISYNSRRLEGLCRIYLALILRLSDDAAGAEREARAAADISGVPVSLRAYALGVLAQALLDQGRAALALSVGEEAAALLRASPEIEEGEAVVNLAHIEALLAAGRGEAAQQALGAARSRLLARADRISDPVWRESFLTRVPDNARILTLARSFLDAQPL